MDTSGGLSKDFPGDLGSGKGVSSTDPLSDPLSVLLSGSSLGTKGDKELGLTETDLLGYDPAAPSHGLSETASKETNRFLDELMSDAINIVPNLGQNKDQNEGKSADSKKLIDDFDFGFEKPLPPEPLGATSDFLKSETGFLKDDDVLKPAPVAPKDDFLSAPEQPPEKSRTPSPAPREETPSPVPPPVPKHQQLRDESPEPYEPTQTPEPDSEFKPVEEAPPRNPSPPPVRPREPTPPPVRPREPTPPPREPTPPPREPTPPPVRPKEPTPPPQKPVEPPPPTPKPAKKLSTEDIGAKDIRSKLNAWFNPARLHPTVESLLYWRDPKKSGAVFGVTMLSLLSLTAFSLISVVAYLSLFTLGGTICFRIYKSIMQAVQKTSDGHPFKDLLELDITIPEDKVNQISKDVVAYVNSSLATLRSLILVEDLIDSIKFLVLSWVLTYIGACFNGLTLIIIGVILLFSLPTVYEKNKAQIDVYVKIAMDKLSIITNKMRAAVPEGKKEEKKDQ